jgi:Kinesin motor domain
MGRQEAGRYCAAFAMDDDTLISVEQTSDIHSFPLYIMLSFSCKTYSMYGASSENDRLVAAGAMSGGGEGTQAGVIPRAIAGIFELSRSIEVLSLSVHCSFLQIYNEQLFDMLRCLHCLCPTQSK